MIHLKSIIIIILALIIISCSQKEKTIANQLQIADSYIRVSFKYVMGRDEQSGISSQNFNQSTKWTDVPSRKVASTEALKADMLSFIRKNPSASYQQIGDDVDIGRSTTRNQIMEQTV